MKFYQEWVSGVKIKFTVISKRQIHILKKKAYFFLRIAIIPLDYRNISYNVKLCTPMLGPELDFGALFSCFATIIYAVVKRKQYTCGNIALCRAYYTYCARLVLNPW